MHGSRDDIDAGGMVSDGPDTTDLFRRAARVCRQNLALTGDQPMLTDTRVKAIQARDRPFKISDAAGLHILVAPSGGRLWRMNFMIHGKQRTLALGSYPTVSLAAARQARDAAKRHLRAGIDPNAVVKVEKVAAAATATTFEIVGNDWLARKVLAEGRSPNTVRRVKWLLGILNSAIGSRPIADIEAPDLLELLRRVEAQGKHESTKRLCNCAGDVFRFAIATGRAKRNPAADLKGALTNKKATPRSAIIDPAAVGKLLRDIDGYQHRPEVRQALQLLALTFVRPSELCQAEWSEFGDDSVWTIPASRMKMRKEFCIPLPRQALTILAELHGKADTRFVFPSRKRNTSLKADTLTLALRKMGYSADEVCAHGFRSTASTLLNSEGNRFSPDDIELCLAHSARGVRAIYDRSKRWPERVELMQWWADRLDELRQRGEVVKLAKKKRG
jgi:integrase